MPKSLTSESLKKLLNAFSPDEAESALAYTKLRDALVRYFHIKGLTETDEAADETLDRVAEKIIQNTRIEDINKYAFGVAKYIFLERIHAIQLQTEAHDEFYLKTQAFENSLENDELEPFRECFKNLYPNEQRLLLDYFSELSGAQAVEHRQNLADREKVSLNALRNRVSRLRKRLEDCLRESF